MLIIKHDGTFLMQTSHKSFAEIGISACEFVDIKPVILIKFVKFTILF